MNAERDMLIVLPEERAGNAPVYHWWKLVDERIVARGCDAMPMAAAGLDSASFAGRAMLLLPPEDCAVQVSIHRDITAAQALVAADMAARDASIGDDLHSATRLITHENADESKAQSVVMDRDTMLARLNEAEQAGVDPDIVLPATLLLPPQGKEPQRAHIGPYTVIVAPDIAVCDDPVLTQALFGDIAIADHPDSLDTLLIAAVGAPALNLRSADFAKRRSINVLQEGQGRALLVMVAILVILTMAVPLARWIGFAIAADQTEQTALTRAQEQFEEAENLSSARQMIDATLIERGAQSHSFSGQFAALLAAMQSVDSAVLQDVRYDASGRLSVILAASDNAAINAVIVPLQQQGYMVQVTQRASASGGAAIDLVMMP